MATITVDYKQAFKNAGLDFSPLEAKGVTVAMNSSGMKFVKQGEVLASVPLAPGKIAELASSPAALKTGAGQTAKATLQSAFQQLESKLGAAGPMTAAATIKHASAGVTVPNHLSSAPPVVASNVSITPLDKMKSMTPVLLAQASQLFQPVKGTSTGSTYFVVGVGPGIRVAARYLGGKEQGKLSIRIEGDQFPKMTTKIQEAGVFGPSFGGTFDHKYASMHLQVAGKTETQRVIGAILGSMAPYIQHPVPDIAPLLAVAA